MSTLTLEQIFEPTRVSTPTARPATPAGPRAPRSSVRLTRRGRLVILLGGLLVALVLGVTWAAGSVATERAGTPEPTRVVTVGTGDTLWDLAAGLADDGGTRAMMARIQRLNALDSGMLVAGQRILVPVE